MSPTATDRQTDPRLRHSPGARLRPRPDLGAWTCPNCRRVTHPPRKRCSDCGTSRY
ncbi:hypothetical protein SAMN06893096_11047 [Geodermatophilus pulveris]|uniref:RanBP2-type domain-containing protein n=1 Tax=Geodermatophilus pulveris TaxID=1564159 RepID=A0A239I7J6_9ACTN|nr:hypothetical protein [Geodermatophilus pulveris]SNS89866.1 hypothetical protein SAMN06893096_11047 [Geodermatophilus pulveris]